MAEGLAKAKAAGIPAVAFNAGLDDWKRTGALAFFGLDIKASGVMEGEEAKAGGKHALCVIQEQGSVVLEALCEGAKRGFGSGTMDNLYVSATNLPTVQATLSAKLTQDPSIDSIVTLGAPTALAAVQAGDDAGHPTKIVTLNMTKDLIEPIKSGKILSTIDRQGWLQGYEAVDSQGTVTVDRPAGSVTIGREAPGRTSPHRSTTGQDTVAVEMHHLKRLFRRPGHAATNRSRKAAAAGWKRRYWPTPFCLVTLSSSLPDSSTREPLVCSAASPSKDPSQSRDLALQPS